MSKKIKRHGATIRKFIMKLLLEILKNTYSITFKEDVSYEWSPFIEPFINSANLYQNLVSNNLLKNEETQEDIQYWQDLFFMEIAELSSTLNVEEQLYQQIKNHPLFIANSTFLNQMPRTTAALGRELLIDELIDNKNADDLINDEMIENVLKKKSRDELRKNFTEWSYELPLAPTGTGIYEKKVFNKNSNTAEKPIVKPSKSKQPLSYIKYLVAASIISIVALIGYNNFDRGYDFDDSEFVNTSTKSIYNDTGLGFTGNERESSITIQIFDFNKASKSDNSVSKKITLNTYLLDDRELKLVLENNDVSVKLIEFDSTRLFLKIDDSFYKIERHNEFKNLEKTKDQQIVNQLEKIIFEYE